MKAASSIAYCSSANLGPGFDVLAVAHNAYYDRVTVSLNEEEKGEQIRIISDNTPLGVEENTAGLALKTLLLDKGINGKIMVSIEKGIPYGLGLGSSGASSAAAVFSANKLFDLNMSLEEMTYYSMKGEVAASGSPHADNVSASIYGDMVIVNSVSPLRVSRIQVSRKFSFLTFMPHIFIHNKTRIAREMVPKEVHMSGLVQNSRYLSSLVAGLISGDSELVKEGMNDGIVEEARSPLFPFYGEIKKAALELDAAGVSISGAGPSILVVCDGMTRIQEIEGMVSGVMKKYGHRWSSVRSEICGGVISENVDAYS